MGVDLIGLNCATGPSEMFEPLRHLSGHSSLPVTCLPNAGLPSVVNGAMHYDLTPEQLAEFHRQFVTELGISVIGGCCGTTPEHLAAVVAACAPSLSAGTSTPRRRVRGGVDLHPGPLRAGHLLPGGGRADQRQRVEKFREAMLEAGTPWQ